MGGRRMRRNEQIFLAVLGILAVAGIVWAARSPDISVAEAQRLDEIRELSPEEKSRLLAHQQRFDRLPEDEKQRLREIQQDVAAETDTLRGVLERYDQWLADLSYAESSDVRSKPPEKRVEKIKTLREKELKSQLDSRASESDLTDADWKVIRNWWSDFVKNNESRLIAKLPPQSQEMLKKLSAKQRQQRLQMMAFSQRKKQGRGKIQIKPTSKNIATLVQSLSPDAQRQLKSKKTSDAQLAIVARWVQADMRRRVKKSIAPYIDPKELERFSREHLSKAEQLKLRKMPEQQRRRELAKRYVRWQLSKRSHPGPRPPQRDRPHRPGHRPPHHGPRGEHHPMDRERRAPGNQPPSREGSRELPPKPPRN
jgi:hypothetical protein